MPRGQTICTFKLLKPCRSISGEFSLTQMLMNPPSTWQCTTTHKFDNRGSTNSDELIFHTHYTAQILLPQIWSPQRCHSWENVWECW